MAGVQQRISSLRAVESQSFSTINSRPQSHRSTVRAAANDSNRNQNDPSSDAGTDWDKEWSSYKKKDARKPLFDLDMEQYVSRKPLHRNFSMTEEVDEFRKAERATLDGWTDPKFTYAGASVILCLFVYMVINTPHA